MSEGLIQFAGRLHPSLVHFPIALVLVAAVCELFRRRPGVSPTALVCLGFGLLGAAAAAGSGWVYSSENGMGADEGLLFRHRWAGVSVAVLTALAWLLGLVARRKTEERSRAYRWTLFVTAALVAVTGHMGGEMVYGEDFLSEPFQERGRGAAPSGSDASDADALQEPDVDALPEDEPTREEEPISEGGSGLADALGAGMEELGSLGDALGAALDGALDDSGVAEDPGHEEPLDVAGTDDPSEGTEGALPVDFTFDVLPIFEAYCYDCHGATGRARAGLRLSDLDSLFDDDPSLALIVPGDPEGSYLFELLTLPAGDEDLMPEEGNPLPPEDIDVIRRWIAEGATYPGG